MQFIGEFLSQSLVVTTAIRSTCMQLNYHNNITELPFLKLALTLI